MPFINKPARSPRILKNQLTETFLNFTTMQIERLNNEILIRLSANMDTTGLQRLLDFLRVKETTSKSKATDDQINEISEESKNDWWIKNKDRFIK